MKTLGQKIEVMQAALDGKEIEIKRVVGLTERDFHCTATPMFDWASFDYRIKPEPLEFWVNVYDDDTGEHCCFSEKSDADDNKVVGLDLGANISKTIKVREVIE